MLTEQISIIEEEIKSLKRTLSSEKSKLLFIESEIVSQKEELSKLKDMKYRHEQASDFESMRDTARDVEIAGFKERLNKEA